MMSNNEEMTEQPIQLLDLSDENQMYTAEYKDGQFHIVEVSPYDKAGDNQHSLNYEQNSIQTDTASDECDEEQTKYLHLDLLNFSIVKNADGTNTYQMVSSDSSTAETGDTITCVLSGDDVDDPDHQESYVMLQTDDEQDPYTFLSTQSSSPEPDTIVINDHKPEPEQSTEKSKETNPKKLTPVQILEKAKAFQKAKAFLANSSVSINKRGRKRKSDLPPPLELLSSPNFKLYLYSCKLCSFKCNAVKEMSAHKKSEHAASKGAVGLRAAFLQCARCPFKGHTHTQLQSHVNKAHAKDIEINSEYITALQLDSEEVEAADVLVCGACGFESGDRPIFKKHIEVEHGAITSMA